jgi:hypothetical protein
VYSNDDEADGQYDASLDSGLVGSIFVGLIDTTNVSSLVHIRTKAALLGEPESRWLQPVRACRGDNDGEDEEGDEKDPKKENSNKRMVTLYIDQLFKGITLHDWVVDG